MSVDTLREECRQWTKSKCTQSTSLSFGTVWLCERVGVVEALWWRGLFSQTFTQLPLYTSTLLPIPAPTTHPPSLSYQVGKHSLTHNKQGLSMYKRTLNYRFFFLMLVIYPYCKNIEKVDSKREIIHIPSQSQPKLILFLVLNCFIFTIYKPKCYTPCSSVRSIHIL